ncbi:MAG TPA: aspartate aminotransferase family protein [Candidatus Dormibacteraeota bacterium]|nr:aspartate aminotransferase family protein [Candidatus Dormibacteraeota bacterium]
MLDSLPTGAASVPDTIRRLGGGGPRRIAESAGVVITHGRGAHLVDSEGRSYVDFATAMGVAGFGHAHPRWAAAIAEQAGQLAATVLHTPMQAEYLAGLAEIVPPGLERVALYSGGTEAVEVALRLAQSATGRNHVVSFTSGFHGKTAGTRFTGRRYAGEREALGIGWVHDVPYPLCTEHDAVSYPDCEGDGAAELAELDRHAATLDGGVAAVIVEPVLGTAGNRPPQRRFLSRLRDLCTRRGWLLILDENITGFGRLGTHFAADWFSVKPDILVMGKAMGGGFPLSGVAAPSSLWDNSLYAEMSATSSSYGANPVACAAGLAVLDILREDGFLDNVREVGAVLGRGIREIEAQSPYVVRSRGVGMMLGFDFVDPATGEPAGPELCKRLFLDTLHRGLLIVGDVPGVRLNPPMTLSVAEAEQALEALAGAVCR